MKPKPMVKKPIASCYLARTTDTPELATLTQDISTEIAIIGAGFTGPYRLPIIWQNAASI